MRAWQLWDQLHSPATAAELARDSGARAAVPELTCDGGARAPGGRAHPRWCSRDDAEHTRDGAPARRPRVSSRLAMRIETEGEKQFDFITSGR
jgi:hypothetical protein